MPVVPPLPRSAIETIETGMRVSIPSRKNWFAIFFLGFWLVGWAFGEIMVLGILATSFFAAFFGNNSETSAGFAGVSGFLLVWITMWTIGGGFAIYTFLWQITGKEIVDINQGSITVARKIFSFSRPKEYEASHIQDLRVSPPAQSAWSPWSMSGRFWGREEGVIAFDYGSRTYRFGGVDEAEAKMILSEITKRYPQYLTRNS